MSKSDSALLRRQRSLNLELPHNQLLDRCFGIRFLSPFQAARSIVFDTITRCHSTFYYLTVCLSIPLQPQLTPTAFIPDHPPHHSSTQCRKQCSLRNASPPFSPRIPLPSYLPSFCYRPQASSFQAPHLFPHPLSEHKQPSPAPSGHSTNPAHPPLYLPPSPCQPSNRYHKLIPEDQTLHSRVRPQQQRMI